MISDERKEKEDAEEQAQRSGDYCRAAAVGRGPESGGGCAGSGRKCDTIYAWKAKYGGMDVNQTQEAKQLREENARLKKLVADLSLDKDALQSVIRKNGWSSQV